MADRIEANYDELQQILQKFNQIAANWENYGTSQFNPKMNRVEETWQGRGANKFKEEMHGTVNKGIKGLTTAMHAGGEHVKKIMDALQQAEEEAGNLFKAD
jgi:WXG100 family type VII secretion target